MTRVRPHPPCAKKPRRRKTKARRQRRPSKSHVKAAHKEMHMYDVDAKLEELDDYECAILQRLMSDNWPSLRWRLKNCRVDGKPLLPKKMDDRLTVVLDLDETLLHTYLDSDAKPSQFDYSFTIPPQFYDFDTDYVVHGSLRPGASRFLEWAASMFELVVWTAGTKVYAEAIVNNLDPEKRLISHVLSQERCIEFHVVPGVACYVKDLELLGRDLRRTIIIDNSPHAATFNLSNFIPIESFFGCEEDHWLDRLRQFLEQCLEAQQAAGEKDIRLVLHRQLDLKRRLRHKVAQWVEEEIMEI